MPMIFEGLQYSVPLPIFSSAVRCFELEAVGMFLLYAHNLGFLFLFSGVIEATVSCLYTAQTRILKFGNSLYVGTDDYV